MQYTLFFSHIHETSPIPSFPFSEPHRPHPHLSPRHPRMRPHPKSPPKVPLFILHNHITPTFQLLKTFCLSHHKALSVLIACPTFIGDFRVASNVTTLLDAGVIHSTIRRILCTRPSVLCSDLTKVIHEVMLLAFDPMKLSFTMALLAKRAVSKSLWYAKVDTFNRWGCSEDEVVAAFKNQPDVMLRSVDKINKVENYGDFRVHVFSSSSEILSLPPAPTGVAAHTASAPADLFGTDTLIQPKSISQTTTGNASEGTKLGPIPEDFFQNTISSLQVAASLRPAGTYLSKYTTEAESGKATPNQASASKANVSLQDDVPPQDIQQSKVHIESVGLPDGGVPPQSSAQTAVMPPSQLQTPISSQPFDLNVLGIPNTSGSEKPPQTGSPASSVKPRQVSQGAAASVCFKTGLTHLELNHLSDALSCFDEAFLSLAKEQSCGSDIKPQHCCETVVTDIPCCEYLWWS